MPAPVPESVLALLARMVQEYTGRSTAPEQLQAVASGASGRFFARAHGVVALYWTAARADNNSFVPAARGLAAAGIRVPTVLTAQELPDGCGACLLQDLGCTDLLSLRGRPWPERRAAYGAALAALRPLYELQPDWALQAPFDAALYRWEQEYFAEHFVGRHLGADAAAFAAQPALREMAAWLGSLPRVPIHRDCQSQNIMLHDGEAWLIDFQGMRAGREEYDVASLLLDPYAELTRDERAELLRMRECLGAPPLDPTVYAACALQRLMQALGAFANIGYNQGRPWYLQKIAPALAALRELLAELPADSPLTPVAACLQPLIAM